MEKNYPDSSWLEQFSGWLCLIHDAYRSELREAIHSPDPIRSFRNHDQTMRSKSLFHLLPQNLFDGFELLRLIRKEFSFLSRFEALEY